MLIYYALALIPVLLLGYVLWLYRNKAAEKEAASRERLVLLMGEGQREVNRGAFVSKRSEEPAPVRKGPPWIARERFLSKPEAVVYYLLKTALRRDHEIFVHVGLPAVVTLPDKVPSFERDQQLRRLAQHDLTFVVCDKTLSVIAVVELAGEAAEPGAEIKAECLKGAGIRLIQVDPAALPPRDAIRALVYGI